MTENRRQLAAQTSRRERAVPGVDIGSTDIRAQNSDQDFARAYLGKLTVWISNGLPGSSKRAMRPSYTWGGIPFGFGEFDAEPLAQIAFEQLSAGVLRQRVDEEHLFGRLESGEVVATMAQDVIFGQSGAGTNDHRGDDGLHPHRMR